MSLRLTNHQLNIVIAGCVTQLDNPETDFNELVILLERFQEMCLHRKLPESLELIQGALKKVKRPPQVPAA